LRSALALAALGGAAFCLGYPGFALWPFALVAWALLFAALEAVRARGLASSSGLGFVFGFVAHAGGFAWLWRLVDVFLGGNVAVGAAFWLAHALWFSAGYALYAALYQLLRARGWPIALAGTAPLVAVEWLQPQLFRAHLGDAFVDRLPVVLIADLGGALAVTALVALANAALFETWRWLRGRRVRPLGTWLAAFVAFAASFAYGAIRLAILERDVAEAPSLRVGIVQGNADVLAKRRDPERVHELHLAQSRALLAEGPVDLVVWPETVYTRGIEGALPVAGHPIRRDLDVPLLFGAATIRSAPDGRSLKYNSALLVGPDGAIRSGYDKNLLVPFAEWVPFEERLRPLFPHALEFGTTDATPPLVLGDFRMATPICYEAAVPSFVRRMVGEARPNLLVMLSNDAWFGDSHEPWIHLAVARMRAIEQRRFVVRATNSGVSAVIDPAGRLVARSGLLTQESLRGTVRAIDATTFYQRAGDWLGWVAAMACVAMAFLRAPGSAER
jgi:apolipoprotein N-acyltransferase